VSVLAHRLLAIGLGIVAGVVLAEGVVRVAHLDRPGLLLALVGSTEPTSAYHPWLGWVNLPDSSGALHFPGAGQTLRLTTNHQGFRFPRDFEREKRRRFRLALVGDSQVFGFGVGDDEHLGVLLDRDMADVETYPFGVPGYGPTQEMLLLADTVLTYRPDVVVAVLFLENDLNDETEDLAYGFLPRPFQLDVDGHFEIANVPVPLPLSPAPPGAHLFLRAASTAFATSALYRFAFFRAAASPFVASGMTRLGLASVRAVTTTDGPGLPPDPGFRRVDGSEPACLLASQCPEEHRLDGLRAMAAAYDRMHRVCESRGIRFVALVTPAVFEIQTLTFPMSNAASRALRALGIETISLAEPFARTAEPQRLIGFDFHWSRKGTRLVATVLRERVRALVDQVR